MKLCKDCVKCGNCGKPYSRMSNYAEECKDFQEKKITNFERIKAMSVDEFVNWVLVDSDDIARGYTDSFIGLKKYLESEVQENDT